MTPYSSSSLCAALGVSPSLPLSLQPTAVVVGMCLHSVCADRGLKAGTCQRSRQGGCDVTAQPDEHAEVSGRYEAANAYVKGNDRVTPNERAGSTGDTTVHVKEGLVEKSNPAPTPPVSDKEHPTMVMIADSPERGITADERARYARIVKRNGSYEYTCCPHCGGDLYSNWLPCDGSYHWRYKCLSCGDLGWEHVIHASIRAWLNALVYRLTGEPERAA